MVLVLDVVAPAAGGKDSAARGYQVRHLPDLAGLCYNDKAI